MWQFWRRRNKESADVLDSGTQTAIVLVPNREYPGAVLQGDTLRVWMNGIDRVVALAERHDDCKLLKDARTLQTMIHGVFDDYNQTCRKFGRGGFDEPHAKPLRVKPN